MLRSSSLLRNYDQILPDYGSSVYIHIANVPTLIETCASMQPAIGPVLDIF